MPRRPSSQPTEVELEILLVLWDHGPCPMGKIHEVLSQRRETGYTTTQKMVQVMRDKGLVTADDSVHPPLHAAADNRRAVRAAAVKAGKQILVREVESKGQVTKAASERASSGLPVEFARRGPMTMPQAATDVPLMEFDPSRSEDDPRRSGPLKMQWRRSIPAPGCRLLRQVIRYPRSLPKN